MTRPIPPNRYQKTNNRSASGGYGEVEIWHDTSLDRDIAIKWTEANFSAQLSREVAALSQHVSPHIVEIYDLIYSADGTLRGIVLEYLEGESFEQTRLTDTSSRETALSLLYQMAKGLADLHRAGLVHRDVKPANAVTTAGGRLKLVDFGLSSAGQGVVTTEARGTLGYAAPEFFSRAPIEVLPSMDVYSFAALCWKKLTGNLPIVGPIGFPDAACFPLRSISSVLNGEPALAMLLDRALSWNPHDRPTIEEIAVQLCAELTHNKHKARLIMGNNQAHDVTTERNKYSTLGGQSGKVDIAYDGYGFYIRGFSGEVRINNQPAVVGRRIDASCLFSLGDPAQPMNRVHVPFRQSSPEIIF